MMLTYHQPYVYNKQNSLISSVLGGVFFSEMPNVPQSCTLNWCDT